MQGFVSSRELPACYKEEGVDLGDTVPAGESSKGWISVWEEEQQKCDHMMPKNESMKGWQRRWLQQYPQEVCYDVQDKDTGDLHQQTILLMFRNNRVEIHRFPQTPSDTTRLNKND